MQLGIFVLQHSRNIGYHYVTVMVSNHCNIVRCSNLDRILPIAGYALLTVNEIRRDILKGHVVAK